MRREFHIALVLIAVASANGFAQQVQSKCAQVQYSERLTDRYHYRLKSIEGQALYGDVSDKISSPPPYVHLSTVNIWSRRYD